MSVIHSRCLLAVAVFLRLLFISRPLPSFSINNRFPKENRMAPRDDHRRLFPGELKFLMEARRRCNFHRNCRLPGLITAGGSEEFISFRSELESAEI